MKKAWPESETGFLEISGLRRKVSEQKPGFFGRQKRDTAPYQKPGFCDISDLRRKSLRRNPVSLAAKSPIRPPIRNQVSVNTKVPQKKTPLTLTPDLTE